MSDKLPDVILLDMDNTIYEYAPCHAGALKAVGDFLEKEENLDRGLFRQSYETARSEINARLRHTAASHNRLLYFQRMLELNGHSMKINLALRLYVLYWDTFIDHIKLLEGVSGFLDLALSRDIPVALVTDLTADIQFRKIDHLKLDERIAAVVTSEEAGVEKPAAGIFELALAKTGVRAGTVWVIGDSLSKDIAGGKAIGAVTFLKEHGDATVGTGKIRPDRVFRSFHELTGMLEGEEANAG